MQPCVAAHAVGWLEDELHFEELGFVKEGGDEATQAGGIYVVICTRVRGKRDAAGDEEKERHMNCIKNTKLQR